MRFAYVAFAGEHDDQRVLAVFERFPDAEQFVKEYGDDPATGIESVYVQTYPWFGQGYRPRKGEEWAVRVDARGEVVSASMVPSWFPPERPAVQQGTPQGALARASSYAIALCAAKRKVSA